MHHGRRFPSSATTLHQAKNNPMPSRAQLVASSVDDIAAVLARGFDTSSPTSSSKTDRPNVKIQNGQLTPTPTPTDNEDDSDKCTTDAASSGMRALFNAKKGDEISGACTTESCSPRNVRGQDAAVVASSGGKRSTRSQKKTAKKWISKRQVGRMPDGAPTTPRGNHLYYQGYCGRGVTSRASDACYDLPREEVVRG
ncbi:unnamed protein product [Laminaria digitata]